MGLVGPPWLKAAARGYLADGGGTPLAAAARAGNVGGTARWAAPGYRTLSPQHPDLTVGSLIKTLLHARFAAEDEVNPGGSAARAWAAMRDVEIRGLAHLVVLVLTAEAGFAHNSPDVRSDFVRVIRDELTGGKVPLAYALGPDADTGLHPDLLLERFGPSMRKLQRGTVERRLRSAALVSNTVLERTASLTAAEQPEACAQLSRTVGLVY